MATLIDGYNLLYEAGILDRRVGPGTLERARNALLGLLARSLDAAERAQTTVVFDAKNGPAGLPRELVYRGVRVVFAVGHENADALLEKLIRADSAPRKLVVVSSDHQIQRAARRRRATPVDSGVWYDELRRQARARAREREQSNAAAEPTESTDLMADSAYWVQVFSERVAQDIAAEGRSVPASTNESPENASSDKPDVDRMDLANPFPPGYAQDLIDEDEHD